MEPGDFQIPLKIGLMESNNILKHGLSSNLSSILTAFTHVALVSSKQLVGALPSQSPTQSVRVPDTGTLIVVADLASTGHSGRCVGVLLVTLGSDGSLTGESWSTRWIDKTIADDPAMQALLDKYR